MLKVKIDIVADSRYKFDRKRVRKAIGELLASRKMTEEIVISVSIVGERKMRELKKKYMGVDEVTDVLSFSQVEGDKVVDTEEGLDLGDVVVCYPVAKRQALKVNKLLDEEIEFLVLHGIKHLLGEHHD